MTKPYDPQSLKELLICEYGYKESSVDSVVRALEKLQPPFLEALADFLSTRTLPKITIERFSYARLRDDYGMNPFAAILTLDLLFRKPEAALELEQGVDEIF